MAQKTSTKKKIAAYGFERLGFKIPQKEMPLGPDKEVCFIGYEDSDRLDEFNGVMIFQGIFEAIKQGKIESDKKQIVERKIQIKNLLEKGAWVCFLVSRIFDNLVSMGYAGEFTDTDLCKQILNDYWH